MESDENNRHRKLSKQSKEEEEEKIFMVLEQGKFKYQEIQRIKEIIKKVEQLYEGNIQAQTNLAVELLNEEFGKNFQMFVCPKTVDEGHHLASVHGKNIYIEYNSIMYLIWQVVMDEK